MEEKKLPIIKIIIGIIFALIMIAVLVVSWYYSSLSGTGTEEEKVTVEIPLGSGGNEIANILKENDIIKNVLAFKIYLKLNQITLFQAGTYEFTKDMTVSEIIDALQTGKVSQKSYVKITFIEGKPFTYFAKQIAANTNITEEEVYALIQNEEYLNSIIEEYWFMTDEIKNEEIYYALEGYLFPDTYEFEIKKVTLEDIFKTLLDKMGEVLEEYKEDIQKSKYTVHEILTVASIIENEAMYDNDRKNVSSVIYNRLENNISLGCDATTYYGAKVELGSRELYQTEIDSSNAYNTRTLNMAGKLPVGPICMPSKASLEAAIIPNETDYLFFVTDSSGNAHFTETNEEHQNIINYLKENNQWLGF